MLAFAFYIACNPDRKEENKDFESGTEVVSGKKDSLVTFAGKVVGIKDGDTFEILRNGKAEKVRLADIDAPESAQAYGRAARKYASNLCYGKVVTVKPKKKRDQFGRVLGLIYTEDSLNVNEEMIKAGYAWRYKYSKNEAFLQLQKEAKVKKLGLWADDNAVNPWQWRKDNK